MVTPALRISNAEGCPGRTSAFAMARRTVAVSVVVVAFASSFGFGSGCLGPPGRVVAVRLVVSSMVGRPAVAYAVA